MSDTKINGVIKYFSIGDAEKINLWEENPNKSVYKYVTTKKKAADIETHKYLSTKFQDCTVCSCSERRTVVCKN
jgi:hypothetical protein